MKKVKVELDFDIGDKVYLLTDPFQYARIVVYVIMYKSVAYYGIRFSDDDPTEHQAFELSENPDLNLNIGKSLDGE